MSSGGLGGCGAGAASIEPGDREAARPWGR